ncbi:ceramide kinase-like isoform X2 [Biomphalaria pfeifferi]|uniref:Ceramide kinase-like isoform X2 n=1 Tax=Biomphalaria pfeifferi TaxID=112525 RepID=A0AAD8B9T1_BIOPF|nr:ceramide kinase-like isoform X2 [Biomphalaria pfeifferi]
METNGQEEDTILTEIVHIKTKQNVLTLTLKGLQVFQSKEDETSATTLKWPDVLCIQPSQTSSETGCYVLQYIHHEANTSLQIKTLQIQEISEQCVSLMNQQIADSGRPKKLFVVINPIGGAGKGLQIYHEEAEPLFKLAGIDATIFVTERSKHALQIGENTDFSQYDGIVVVGGDGLYQELLQGITLQEQKKSGINYDSPDTDLVKLNIPPIGIIPAGTGNATVRFYNGGFFTVRRTAILNIIRGERYRASVFAVYSNSKFFNVSHLQVTCGLFADIMKRAEELRWMKKFRYFYSILGQILFSRKRYFDAEVYYRTLDVNSGVVVEANSSDWISLKPAIQHCYSIYAMPFELVDTGNTKYVNPFGQHCHLVISTGCSQLSSLLSLVSQNKTSKPGMEVMTNIIEFKIKVRRENSASPISDREARDIHLEKGIQIDGEFLKLETPEFSVRLQTSFVPVFGCKPAVT